VDYYFQLKLAVLPIIGAEQQLSERRKTGCFQKKSVFSSSNQKLLFRANQQSEQQLLETNAFLNYRFVTGTAFFLFRCFLHSEMVLRPSLCSNSRKSKKASRFCLSS
jgi:hypothetical protein